MERRKNEMNPTPYDDAFYETQVTGSLLSARRILPPLLGVLPIRTVLDVGCGLGAFLNVAAELGAEGVCGLDGDYVSREKLLIGPDRFLPTDLGRPFDIGRTFDLVISLEVAEHLSQERADGFVDDVCRHGNLILFSAAVPRQGGKGHRNEQWQSYWAEKFRSRGYHAFDFLRKRLWSDAQVEGWYRQNIVIYAKEDGGPLFNTVTAIAPPVAELGNLDVVHPEIYNSSHTWQEKTISILNILTAMAMDGGAFKVRFLESGQFVVQKQ